MKNHFFLIVIILFTSCSKQNNEFLNLNISPATQYDIREVGDIINYIIESSSNVTIKQIGVIEIINNSSIDTLFSFNASENEVKQSFIYQVPDYSDTTNVKLIFYVKNDNNEYLERAKLITVVPKVILLTETTGHTMFSNNSTEFNSYNLITGTPTYNSDTTSHISDNTDSITDILSRKWISMSGLLFSKNNSFDYANATRETIKNTYNSSLKKEFIDQISDNDIIITKIDNNYLILKIIYVIDGVGSENDRYIFNIKNRK